ncbi:hypothetical protein AQS70_09220 [Pseudomonas endophytica]|uniref:Uncharacterized protein n=2 Tax=Pseudomonas endophytica TaxID=1563157 RepID=A0A0Q1CGK9_9PSED|nr:hypothetical protein AQS70_09220 [Pseudomonas endophytica]
MFAVFKPAASRTTEFRAIMSLDDGTARNRLQAYMAAPAGNAEFRASSGDISVPVPSIPAAYPPNINKLGKSALSYDSKGLTGVAGSVLSKARIAFTPPEVTSLKIGSNQSQSQLLNGHILSISYYPRRLTDSELEALTT